MNLSKSESDSYNDFRVIGLGFPGDHFLKRKFENVESDIFDQMLDQRSTRRRDSPHQMGRRPCVGHRFETRILAHIR